MAAGLSDMVAQAYDWVKRKLQNAGLVAQNKKLGTYRKKRPRKPMPVMMLHQDGSSPNYLIVTMDDATSEIYSAFFVDEEGIWSTFNVLKEVILKPDISINY